MNFTRPGHRARIDIHASKEVAVEQRCKGAREIFAMQPHSPAYSILEPHKKTVVWFRYYFDGVPMLPYGCGSDLSPASTCFTTWVSFSAEKGFGR